MENHHEFEIGSMETKVIEIKDANEPLTFKPAVALLRAGNPVAFPTETVYGLGANALDANAVKKIFLVKNRPSDNPLIVHVCSEEMLSRLVEEIPDSARVLMKAFWPGPLTILFKKSHRVPEEVTCGQPTVAVRMPSHPIALKLIELSDCPIAAPSANLSGRPSPTCARHVFEDLQGRVQCILDGGDCDVGLESTVVDLERKMILRPGGVTLEALRSYIPDMKLFAKEASAEARAEMEASPSTPGMKYRHYSPKAQVVLLVGSDLARMQRIVEEKFEELVPLNQSLGILHTQSQIVYSDRLLQSPLVHLVSLGSEHAPEIVAKGLFKALRDLDTLGVSLIMMEGIADTNEGLAVMNRIGKAASLTIDLDRC